MKKDVSSKILNILVILGIMLTILALLIAPSVLSESFGGLSKNVVRSITIGLYICAIPYVTALFMLKKLCKLISINKPFSKEVPKTLKNISICAFVEIVIFNLVTIVLSFVYIYEKDMFFSTMMSSMIISFVILAIGFLSLVTSKLFKMAIEIKEENDKTI